MGAAERVESPAGRRRIILLGKLAQPRESLLHRVSTKDAYFSPFTHRESVDCGVSGVRLAARPQRAETFAFKRDGLGA
ncbi:hypothetical protein [Streptomyces sp. NPDC001070]